MGIKTDNTQVILNLEQENTQLKARIARLEYACNLYEKAMDEPCYCPDSEYGCPYCDTAIKAQKVLNETEQQSLNEMDVDRNNLIAYSTHLRRALSEIYNDCTNDYNAVLRIAINALDDAKRLPHPSPVTVDKVITDIQVNAVMDYDFARRMRKSSEPALTPAEYAEQIRNKDGEQ